jgi:predicted ATPase
LDITNQIAFWRKVVPMLKEYQVIIATHSPFLFTMPTPLNIIDIQPGYSAECRTMLKELEFDPFKL